SQGAATILKTLHRVVRPINRPGCSSAQRNIAVLVPNEVQDLPVTRRTRSGDDVNLPARVGANLIANNVKCSQLFIVDKLLILLRSPDLPTNDCYHATTHVAAWTRKRHHSRSTGIFI